MYKKVADRLRGVKKSSRTFGKPVYLCIRQALEEMIISGELPDNYRLPPDRELANLIGVTHITLGKGLNELRKQGLLERSRYRGTYVRAVVDDEKFVRTDKSNLVAIVFDDVNEKTFHSDLFVALHSVLRDKGYEIMFLSSSGRSEVQFNQIRSILQKPNCCGCIVWSSLHSHHIRELMNMKPIDFPLVLMDKYYEDVSHDCAIYDNFGSAVQVGDIFIRRGYRQFKFLYREESFEYTPVHDRYRGLRRSFVKHNIDPENVMLVAYQDISDINIEDFIRNSENAVLFAATDSDANNITERAEKSGYKISESYPIVSWGGSLLDIDTMANISEFVIFDVKALAEGAVSILLERLNGDRGNWKRFKSKWTLYKKELSPELCDARKSVLNRTSLT